MDSNDAVFAGEDGGQFQDDLRQQISTALLERIDTITSDTMAIFPYSGSDEALDQEYCQQVGRLLLQLLAFAVRDGLLDPRGRFVANLPLAQRLQNLRAAFFVHPRLRERLAQRHVALIDDVMTSGATLHEATATLLRAGAARVDAWVLARTPPPQH